MRLARCLGWRTLLLYIAVLGTVGTVRPSTARAAAWTQEQNSFYFQLRYSYGRASGSYLPDGTFYDWQKPATLDGTPVGARLRNAQQTDNLLTFLAEYGLLDPLTLVVSWDVRSISKDLGPDADESIRSSSTSGVPEVRMGLRARLLKAPLVLSFEVLVGVPAQAPRVEPYVPVKPPGMFLQIPQPYDPQTQAVLGIGTTNATFWMHLGKAWGELFPSARRWIDFYTNIALGFELRQQFLSSFVFNTELGLYFLRYGLFLARYYGEKNVGEAHFLKAFDVSVGQWDQQRFLVGLGLQLFDRRLGFLVDYSAPTGGSNTAAFQRVGVTIGGGY